MTDRTIDADVVVVGCGIAGLSAAITAQQSGAKVALLERAPKEERGGNTRYTESFWRMKSEDEVSEDFETHFAKNSGGYIDPEIMKDATRDYNDWPSILRTLNFADPELISTFAAEAGPTLKWLKNFGVSFDFLPNYFISESTTRIAPIGGGWALVEALAKYIESVPDEVSIHYKTTAKSLIVDHEGRISGLNAVAENNRPLRFDTRGVILACGGFEGNPEMLSHYLGPDAQWIRPIARGGYYNRGEGVRMALDIGAAPAGDFGSFHAQPVDPRSGAIEPVVLSYAYGVLVNRDGNRFTDEAPDSVDATYEAVTRIILKQPEGIAYAIHDAKMDEIDNWQKAIRSDKPAIEASTLAELAEKLGVDAERLQASIAAFNQSCPPDTANFDAKRPDGVATSGLEPRKSHWARPIDRPPFKAWPIMSAVCFTFGGLKTSPSAQVLNMDGEIIPGLYAAGETMGIYYRTYTGATSVMRGAVFGRKAGADAAHRFARPNTD